MLRLSLGRYPRNRADQHETTLLSALRRVRSDRKLEPQRVAVEPVSPRPESSRARADSRIGKSRMDILPLLAGNADGAVQEKAGNTYSLSAGKNRVVDVGLSAVVTTTRSRCGTTMIL